MTIRSTTPLGKLKQKSTRLISNFLEKKVPDFMEQRSRIFDDYFRESLETSTAGHKIGMTKNPYAIVALGGYGRKELCLHSDIDLLFLFKKAVPDETEALIREIVYPLWDLGLDIGHATRSNKECLSLASKDVEVLTSLLDARFVCGMSPLYSELMEQLRERFIQKKPENIIYQLVENNRARHQHFGDSTYLLEPNLKEGQGGIRDYHTMLWIAKIESEIRTPRDLEMYGHVSHGEYQALEKTLSFIWNVRSHLHYLSGRKCDQLHFEYQTELADILKYTKQNGQQPVERFLGNLHGKMESLKQQYAMFLYEQGFATEKKQKKKASIHAELAGLEIKEGSLYFISSEEILKSPDLLINIFKESVRLKIPLSAEAKQLTKEFAYLIDDRIRTSESFVKSFERILLAPNPQSNVLDEMLSSGILGQFLPPFKNIVNRIQYDTYHLYPVDKHVLLTVRTIKKFATNELNTIAPLCHDLYKELSNKKLLFWAALLHDIGKGVQEKGHSHRGAVIVDETLKELNFKNKDIETVHFLVKEHLLLVKTATRRDINDEETAISCAKAVKKINRLKMLYILTVADSISTGPKAWNDWTSALMRSLFLKILSIMEKGELATAETIKIVEEKKKKVLSAVAVQKEREDWETLFNFMSPRYLIYMPAQDILKHFRLYKRLGHESFAWDINETSDTNARTVTVCAGDRPGLFSKIAGTFTLNGIDILDSQIYTWRNNIALDIFKVTAPPDRLFEAERWAKAEKDLKAALKGELDLGDALSKKMANYRSQPHLSEKPNKIVVDNNSSSFFTIVEVFTYDFPGLLFSITDALFRCRLDIWVAKIATKIDQVVDVFYVRDFEGQKVDNPYQVEKIKETITDVLSGTSSEAL